METMEFDVTGNLRFNTQQGINDIKNVTDNLKNSGLDGIGGVQGDKLMNNLAFNLQGLNDVLNQVMSNFKVFNDQLKNNKAINQSTTPGSTDDVSGENNIFKRFGGNVKSGISTTLGITGIGLGAYQGYQAYQRQMMRGNWLDAGVTGLNTASGVLSGFGSSMMGAGTALMGTPLGIPLALVGGLLSLGSQVVKGVSAKKETENEAYRMYSENFDRFDKFNIAYGKSNIYEKNSDGTIKYKTYDEQSKAAATATLQMVKARNIATGLSDADFIDDVNKLARYGFNKTDIEQVVQRSAYAANWTNADKDSIENLVGLYQKYGNNGLNTLNSLFANKGKGGFTDVQFDELIQGITNAMEKGISKGFVVNTNNMLKSQEALKVASEGEKFSAFWSGSEGQKRIETFANAMGGAKGLNSVEDVIMYRAASEVLGKDKNGIQDVRQYLEQGNFDEKYLQNLNSQLTKYYGNDENSWVAALEKMGFSTTLARQYYNMRGKISGIQNGSIKLNDGTIINANETAGTKAQDLENELTRKEAFNVDNLRRLQNEIVWKVSDVNDDLYDSGVFGNVKDNPVGISLKELAFEATNGSSTSIQAQAYITAVQLEKEAKRTGNNQKLQSYYDAVASVVTDVDKEGGFVFNETKLEEIITKAMQGVTVQLVTN